MPITITEPVLNADEAAARLKISVGRVYQLARTGELESLRFGKSRLFPLSVVVAFRRQPPGRKRLEKCASCHRP